MKREIGGSSLVDAACHREAGLHPLLLRLMEQGESGIALGVLAYVPVQGLLSDGKRGTACAGVRHELVHAIGAREARHREIVEVQVAAVERPRHADLLEAHTVTDHEDDVLDLLGFRLGHRHGLVGLGHGVFVVFTELVVGILGQVTALVHLCER